MWHLVFDMTFVIWHFWHVWHVWHLRIEIWDLTFDITGCPGTSSTTTFVKDLKKIWNIHIWKTFVIEKKSVTYSLNNIGLRDASASKNAATCWANSLTVSFEKTSTVISIVHTWDKMKDLCQLGLTYLGVKWVVW